MIPYKNKSSSSGKRKRVAEACAQPSGLLPPRFSRFSYRKAQKLCERLQLPVKPWIRGVMVANLVHPVQPFQSVLRLLPVQSASHTQILPTSLPNEPIQFETGNNSIAVLTKTQRKNRKVRMKKRMLREKKEKGDEVICETFPLLEGEEDVEKVEALSPISPKDCKELAPEEITEKLEQQLKGVLQRTTEKSIKTEEEVIRRMKGMVSQSLVGPLMEENNTSVDNNTVIVQSYKLRLADSEETHLVDSTVSSSEFLSKSKVNVRNQSRQMVSSPSISNTTKFEDPLRFRGPAEEDESSIPFDELQVQGHTFNSLLDGKSLSHTSEVPSSSESMKVRRPNSADQSIKEPIKVNINEEYVSSKINHEQPISEKPIEKLMDDLRASLCKMDEEGSDKDNDDLSMDEELYGVNSRSSSLPGDPHTDELLEVEVEEDGNASLIRQLLQQLKRKDEYIMAIQKRMEEMTTAMIALIKQLAGSQQHQQ